ncbi:MAG: sugar ABC transporter permease [Clostridia bacterium]|nr:sugar ABC transporter permease [Clostridia bacterium]
MTKLQWTLKEMKNNWVAYAMLAPYYAIFLLFTIVPVFVSLFLSFTTYDIINPPVWAAMENYARLFLDDDIFILACQNTLIFAAITGPVSYILSFLVAWFINELPPKIRAVITLIFYAPNISGSVYLIWGTLFSSDAYGWANGILMDLEIIDSPILFFQNATYVMPLCIVVALWTSLGTSFLSFIAGLQVVDRSLYEAGAVDGVKNRWQELWYITLPYMKPQLMFGAILSITGSFGFGGIVDALAGNPSVDYCAWTIVHHLGDYGGARYEIGYASAIATILFLIMVGCNMLIKKLLSKVGS